MTSDDQNALSGTETRTCVFCGAEGELTREHVLADWIGEAFGITDPQAHWQAAEGDASLERRYQQQPFRMKVRALCEACNHGWSSDLENKVKPVLRPMLLSDLSFQLSSTHQHDLSLWAAKTLLVSQFMVPEDQRVVPAAQYGEIYAGQCAPARCRIAVARRARDNASWPYRLISIGGQWRRTPPPGPRPRRDQYDTYRAVLAIGHLVIHLIGAYEHAPSGELVAADLPAGFVDIWPTKPRLLWPPEPLVTMAQAERFMALGQVTVARRRSPTDAPPP